MNHQPSLVVQLSPYLRELDQRAERMRQEYLSENKRKYEAECKRMGRPTRAADRKAGSSGRAESGI